MGLSIILTGAALIVGFLAGLLTFRRASHWCPICGVTLACPEPDHARRARTAVRSVGTGA